MVCSKCGKDTWLRRCKTCGEIYCDSCSTREDSSIFVFHCPEDNRGLDLVLESVPEEVLDIRV